MNPNAAPLDVIHKSRLMLILIGIAFLMCLWLEISAGFRTGLEIILFGLVALIALYFLFFEIQTVVFFPTYILINYILRKRRIERADIDFVSMETRRTTVSGVPTRYRYVQMRLRNGRKIKFGSFKEGINVVYDKLKACESTNEEFLRGR